MRRGDASDRSLAAESGDLSFGGGGIWESSGETAAGNWESRSRERPRSAKGRNRRSRHGEQEINQQVWGRDSLVCKKMSEMFQGMIWFTLRMSEHILNSMWTILKNSGSH